MGNIDKDTMARTCSQLLSRVLECVVVDGDSIELYHFLYIYLSYVFCLSKICVIFFSINLQCSSPEIAHAL